MGVEGGEAGARKQSLLDKFDMPIDRLSYEYIGECRDAKELERIVRVLRSGEEGSYPQLTATAEARLASLRPDSTLLRRPEPVRARASLGPSERRELDAELDGWLAEMRLLERDLAEEGREAEPLPRPEVRPTSVRELDKAQCARGKAHRLSSCDYAGWEKYDADTELSRLELEEERRVAEGRRVQRLRDAGRRDQALVDKSLLTGSEQHVLGAREREKGNEAYRAGEYAEALRLYSASIALDGDVAVFNNRAATYIKLKKYEDALKDCNTVLQADCMNVKALLRRGFALEHLNKPVEALKDYEKILIVDPTNAAATSSIRKLRKDDESRKVRLTIEEMQ